MNHTEQTTWIQYRCEHCGDPITEARPGLMEFYSKTDGIYVMPNHNQGVYATVRHDECGEELNRSYKIYLPSQLDRLGDNCNSSLDDWRRHLSMKNWCYVLVMAALNNWEPVSNDAAEPPIRCESTDDDGDDPHAHEPADRSEKTGD